MVCEGCSPFKCCRPLGFIRQCSSRMKNRKIVLMLVGLDNAGKTSTVKGLSREPVDSVMPTVGFATVRLKHRGYSVVIYDVGGSAQIRPIWDRYFADVHGLMFVVDASDSARIDESRKVLEDVLAHDKISGKPLLLLANKQDRGGALDELDAVDRLDVERLANRYRCPTLVETCCARLPSARMDPGVLNGYRWLLRRIISEYEELNARVERDSEEQRVTQEAARQSWLSKRQKALGEADNETDESLLETGDPFKPVRSLVAKRNGHLTGGDAAETRGGGVYVVPLPTTSSNVMQVIGEPQPLDVVIAVKEQFERKMQRQKRTRGLALTRVYRTAPSSAEVQSAGSGRKWEWQPAQRWAEARPSTAPPPAVRGGWNLDLELEEVYPRTTSEVSSGASTVVLRSPHSVFQSDDDDRDVVCAFR